MVRVADGKCYNGLANNVTFNFLLPPLPNSVVYGIAYNTTGFGPSPIGITATLLYQFSRVILTTR